MTKLSFTISIFDTSRFFNLHLKNTVYIFFLIALRQVLSACQSDSIEQSVDDSLATAKAGSHFELLSAEQNGITFKN